MAKLVKLNKTELQNISKNENIPIDVAEQFYLKNFSDNKVFVTRAGILHKLLTKHDTGVSIEVTVPSSEEMERIWLMMSYDKASRKRMVVMKCSITTPEAKYSDIGTASDENTSNKAYLIEMASSRAICRAGRLAIGEKYCSTDEIGMEPEVIDDVAVAETVKKKYDSNNEIDLQKARKEVASIIVNKIYDKTKVTEHVNERFKKPLSQLTIDELREVARLLEDTTNEHLFSVNKQVNNSNPSLDEQIIQAGVNAGFQQDKVLVSIKQKWNKELKDLSGTEKQQILEKLSTMNTKQLKAA